MSSRRPKPGQKIKPAARRMTNEQQVNEIWERLSTAIREIYRKNASVLSFEELYRNAYNMVLFKAGARLYNGVREVVSDHLRSVASDVASSFPQGTSEGTMSGGPEFLKKLDNVWNEHTTCMNMISDILMYMDRVYVKTAQVPVVYELGMDLFRDVIVHSGEHPIQTYMVDTLLNQVRLERDGEMIDRMVVKSVINMLRILRSRTVDYDSGGSSSVYETDFEPEFLRTSRVFYQMESQIFLRECDAVEYLKKVEKRLQEEQQRTKSYLVSSTGLKIQRIVEDELLKQHVKTVIEMENSGLIPMIANDKIHDLSRMYTLYQRVENGHPEMMAAIAAHIKDLGRDVNETYGGVSTASPPSSHAQGGASDGSLSRLKGKSTSSLSLNEAAENGAAGSSSSSATPQPQMAANPIKWVEAVLALKDKFDVILDSAFYKDKAFQTQMNSALEAVVNQNPKGPEFLSLFIDENLKKGLKGKSEAEIDSLLDKTITLFRFISEKDVFERYYKQHLAKRLLYGRSMSEDAEKSMIGKLKGECGYQFTTKLEGMFNDMRISADMMSDFRTYLNNSVRASSENLPDLNISVLTSTFWPMNTTVTSISCQFPPEINTSMEQFKRFYLSRHSGRRLTWLTHMGSADLRAYFEKGRKDINLSTFGMVVLVGVFNNVADEWVDYQRIRELTDIPDTELKRTLQSLSVAKYKVLLKSSKGKDVADSDKFKVNISFTSPLNKIKIPTIIGSSSSSSSSGTASSTGNAMENDNERADTMEKIDEARKHQVEAAVVRIMKARKAMEHNNLVAEVIRQLSARFSPSPVMVKKRIEGLIEREYLERDKADRKLYKYLA
ncbi:hypothetical protein HK102_004647 [Quaeritorhiza haematococci]|nr:hypothetical protein HK102_004647 [Quaeritorhiza haematococci]